MRFSLAGSLLPGRHARCARFPTCGVVRVVGYSVVWDLSSPPPFPLKSTKRSAAAILGRSAPSLLFSWCASDYSVVSRISCYVTYDNIGTNVCQWLFAENFLLLILLLNRFHQQFKISTFDDDRINATNILIVIAFACKLHSCYALSALPPTNKTQISIRMDYPHTDQCGDSL